MAEKRPTILQIIPELETGGAELAALEISEALARAGGRSIVLSEGGRLVSALVAAGGEFVPFPAATKNPVRIVLNARAITALIEREGVDLVHARSRAPAWSALIAARRAGRPFVTTYHGAYKEKGRLKSWYNSVMARGDVVIANSRFTADLIQSRYGTESARLKVVYRGVDGRHFDPSAVAPERVAALRAAWGIAADAPVILHAARLTSWKGQSVVIAAARRLAGEGRLGKAVVVFAGDDQGRSEYAATLQAEAAAAGLADRVRQVGHVSDMAAAFKAAHVAVVASTEPEAFGRAATEAMIMGCPVIATSIGAPPETVLAAPRFAPAETTGWLVPPADVAALAAALAECLALAPETRAALGRRAREHVLSTFSLEQMKRETLEVYDGLLGTHLAATFQRATPPPPTAVAETGRA